MMKYIISNLKAIRHIWKIDKKYVILFFLIPIIGIPFQVADVYVIKYITDSLVGLHSLSFVVPVVLVHGLIKFVQDLLGNIYLKKIQTVNRKKVEQRLKLEFLQKIATLDIECFENADFYNKYVRASAEAPRRYFTVLDNVSGFITSVLTLLIYMSVLISLDGIMIAFAILPVLVTMIFLNKLNVLKFNFEQETVFLSRKENYINRIFYLREYAKEIKLNSSEHFFWGKLKQTYKEYNALLKKQSSKELRIKMVESVFSRLIPVAMQFYLIIRTIKGYFSVGSYVALENATWRTTSYIQSILRIIPSLKQNSLYLEVVDEIMNYEPKIKNKNQSMLLNKEHPHEILVKNVSFTYPNSQEQVVKNISMKISPGEKIAIVGYNGAGKSTFIKLLMRLYDANFGEIKYDGTPIGQYELESLRQNFGTTFQDFQYYAFSIAENILFKDVNNLDSADIQKINDAIEFAGLTEKIGKLDKGIFTPLTKEFDNEGVIFSGGEMQKLALARAYAQMNTIMILDEPTTAMDPLAESKLYDKLFQLTENKTIIYITHKLSVAKMADTIYFFENGEVVEFGSHQNLIDMNGKYAQLFNIQAKFYDDKGGENLAE